MSEIPTQKSLTGEIQPLSWRHIETQFVGKTFRRRVRGVQETRRVTDCTLGGDVVCRIGRAPYSRTIKQGEFLEWVKGAKQI